MASADVSCSVCLAEARDPRQVPCGNGHVFCLSCLQGLVTHGKNVKGSSFPCPCCRNGVTIPPGGVAAFPSVGEAGSSDTGSAAPKRRPPLPAGRFFNGHDRPPRAAREGRGGFGPFGRNDFAGFAMGAGLPFPGPPRRMNHPFIPPFARPFDPEMDGDRGHRQGRDPPERFPGARHDVFRRQFEPPHALSSILSGAQPSLSSASGEPVRQPLGRARGQGGRRGRRGWARGPRGPAGGLADASDDLDMDEVMLVIAQMEEEEQQARAELEQDQDVLLRIQMEQEQQATAELEQDQEVLLRIQQMEQEQHAIADLEQDQEVLLRIQQMEQEQHAIADLEQDQDMLLRIQNEINEDEDFLEAVCDAS